MLFVIYLLVLAVLLLLVLLLMQRRTINNQEIQMRRLVPAYVDATLALTTAQETTRFVLALVPQPAPEVRAASDAELDAHIEDALRLAAPTPRFAPVVPIRPSVG